LYTVSRTVNSKTAKCTRLQRMSTFDVHGSAQRKRISKYNQQDATLHNLFISVKCSTCFRRFLHPSSGAQNCIYSILSNLYCYLPRQ